MQTKLGKFVFLWVAIVAPNNKPIMANELPPTNLE